MCLGREMDILKDKRGKNYKGKGEIEDMSFVFVSQRVSETKARCAVFLFWHGHPKFSVLSTTHDILEHIITMHQHLAMRLQGKICMSYIK